MSKPRLLILSHVLPFPGNAGQQQRVFYTLQAARKYFHVTFATSVATAKVKEVTEKLLALCDDVMLLPSRYPQHLAGRVWHKAIGAVRSLTTGLKYSNYVIGELEFSPDRVASILNGNNFDCVLFEYWHAAESTSVFHRKGMPCLLDMHNILWQDYARDLKANRRVPELWRNRAIRRYQKQEEDAWNKFDGLITINRKEHEYVEKLTSKSLRLFYVPMGTDLNLWPYSWKPVRPIRLAYYGGLGSQHNQRDAVRCYEKIMPEIWRSYPDAELWLIGGNPPKFLRALAADPRVKVTGFVKDVQKLLSTMSAVFCPWTGTYGFRSRLIEVMALGVPVVASRDAIYGMEMEHGKELLIGETDNDLARHALSLLNDERSSANQGQQARRSVERLYSLDNTYDRLMYELTGWLQQMDQRKIA